MNFYVVTAIHKNMKSDSVPYKLRKDLLLAIFCSSFHISVSSTPAQTPVVGCRECSIKAKTRKNKNEYKKYDDACESEWQFSFPEAHDTDDSLFVLIDAR